MPLLYILGRPGLGPHINIIVIFIVNDRDKWFLNWDPQTVTTIARPQNSSLVFCWANMETIIVHLPLSSLRDVTRAHNSCVRSNREAFLIRMSYYKLLF